MVGAGVVVLGAAVVEGAVVVAGLTPYGLVEGGRTLITMSSFHQIINQ